MAHDIPNNPDDFEHLVGEIPVNAVRYCGVLGWRFWDNHDLSLEDLLNSHPWYELKNQNGGKGHDNFYLSEYDFRRFNELCNLLINQASINDWENIAKFFMSRGHISSSYEICYFYSKCFGGHGKILNIMSELSWRMGDLEDCVVIARAALQGSEELALVSLFNGADAAILLNDCDICDVIIEYIKAYADISGRTGRIVSALEEKNEKKKEELEIIKQKIFKNKWSPNFNSIKHAVDIKEMNSAKVLWLSAVLSHKNQREWRGLDLELTSRLYNFELNTVFRRDYKKKHARIQFSERLIRQGDFVAAGELAASALDAPFAALSERADERLARGVELLGTGMMGGGIRPSRVAALLAGGNFMPKAAAIAHLVSGGLGVARQKSLIAASPRTRPRIALCLAGQLRSGLVAWPRTKAALINCDVDIFFFSWPKVMAGLGVGHKADTTFLRRRLNKSVAIPRGIGADIIEKRYPSLFKVLTEEVTISVSQAKEFFGTDNVELANETEFEKSYANCAELHFEGKLNQAKMFYGISRAYEMMRGKEALQGGAYDLVFRLRPDRPLTQLGVEDMVRAQQPNMLLSSYFRHLGVGDQVILSSSGAASSYGTIWSRMLAAGSAKLTSDFSGRFAEWLLGETLCLSGMQLGNFVDTKLGGFEPLNVSTVSVWEGLKQDLKDLKDIEVRDVEFANAVINGIYGETRDQNLFVSERDILSRLIK